MSDNANAARLRCIFILEHRKKLIINLIFQINHSSYWSATNRSEQRSAWFIYRAQCLVWLRFPAVCFPLRPDFILMKICPVGSFSAGQPRVIHLCDSGERSRVCFPSLKDPSLFFNAKKRITGKTERRVEEWRFERDESVAVPTSQCWSVNGAAHPSLQGVSSLSCSMCTHYTLQTTA